MKEGRDFAIIYHINSHFADLQKDLSGIASFDEFVRAEERRRAILFDFLQIGELLNQLSNSFLKSFGSQDATRIISIRNRIVHGYSTIRDDIIFAALKEEMPPFIQTLNDFARQQYRGKAEKLLGKRVKVIVDRPIGFNHNGVLFPINYGYVSNLTALDGEFQDAYIVGLNKPASEISGTVIAIVRRQNDTEDKLVVAAETKDLTADEIEKAIDFQERFFVHSLLLPKKVS